MSTIELIGLYFAFAAIGATIGVIINETRHRLICHNCKHKNVEK